MFDVRRKVNSKPIVVIRAATGHELSNYEKRKLASVEEGAQKNKIEAISINGTKQYLDPINKEVKINLSDLAFKEKITPADISAEDLFFIKCELEN